MKSEQQIEQLEKELQELLQGVMQAPLKGSMTKRVEVDSSGLLWRAQSGRLLN